MNKLDALIPALLLVVAMPAQAECMRRGDAQEASSPSREFRVRVTPGDRLGDVRGFSHLPREGKYASVDWYQLKYGTYEKVRTATLLSPIEPAEIMVSDDGTLVAIDNWCSVGVGTVLVIHSANGEVIKKYSLDDLHSPRSQGKFWQMAEGIPWRCNSASSLSMTSLNELLITDANGGRLAFKLDTGKFTYEPAGASCNGKEQKP